LKEVSPQRRKEKEQRRRAEKHQRFEESEFLFFWKLCVLCAFAVHFAVDSNFREV